jgi:ABC-type dipeptide/oligopeptide/nickel transport system permease component
MKVPRTRALPYTIVVIVAAIVIYLLIGVVAGVVTFDGHVVFYG